MQNFRKIKIAILLTVAVYKQDVFALDILKPFAGPLLSPLLSWNKQKKEDQKNDEQDKKNKNENNSLLINPRSINETLESVIVDDNIKKTLQTIIEFLKQPKKFNEIGAKVPRGILFYGPPGTGKTSLGRALAKEAHCNFLYVAGSEIDDMWVGSGAEKIQILFGLAKKYAPAIIFIDEIDTLAKKRSGYESRFNSQTIQQLLVEMDGFKKENKPVIVVGTTNRIDYLDNALLRSGRFDLHLAIENPNLENRKKIFSKYLQKIKLSENIALEDLYKLCENMKNFSGADIENLVNKASLEAVMSKKASVELYHFENALNDLIKQKKKSQG